MMTEKSRYEGFCSQVKKMVLNIDILYLKWKFTLQVCLTSKKFYKHTMSKDSAFLTESLGIHLLNRKELNYERHRENIQRLDQATD